MSKKYKKKLDSEEMWFMLFGFILLVIGGIFNLIGTAIAGGFIYFTTVYDYHKRS